MPLSPERLNAAFETAHAMLLAERTPAGFWIGELSTSALSTATAVGALAMLDRGHRDKIHAGIQWLAAHQNPDGGWGDTDRSVSNISTTMLVRAAIHLAKAADEYASNLDRAIAYLDARCGPGIRNHAEGIRARYGTDRTFSVPILATCALAGIVAWDETPPLPFELSCFPQSWFRFLQLPVVSYALPALIALGQLIHHKKPSRNPIVRLIRCAAKKRSLRVLTSIQPSSGGFLEAIPLTSFVVMSLSGIGASDHPVAKLGERFLVDAVRPDGSWPIDSNLSVWVTTLSINALHSAGTLDSLERKSELHEWLVAQQGQTRHPYTGAEPGAWGWSHLPGSVPDADDTPGALLALAHLAEGHSAHGPHVPTSNQVVSSGVRWLARLQNRDGGWPTFCRGWGHLPFDRSGPDLTAHVLRAFAAWKKDPVTFSGLAYLAKTQRPDGAWLPLWFGNQHGRDDENPTYGTARVLAAYADLDLRNDPCVRRGVAWLLSAQNADGSWGGDIGIAGSVEETALAIDALIQMNVEDSDSVHRGIAWLVAAVEAGRLNDPSPIGFYFAKLWYYERLYPIIFTVSALGRARCKRRGEPSRPDLARVPST